MKKYRHGFGIVRAFAIGALILIAGGAYLYLHALHTPVSPISDTPTITITTNGTNQSSATIGQGTFAWNSATSTIAGTYSGTSSICVEIATSTLPANWTNASASYISDYSHCSGDLGPDSAAAPLQISNGHWSMPLNDDPGAFSNGTYYVAVYDDTGKLLTNGQLTLSGLPPAPTCTITVTPSSASVGQSITISWASQNATDGNWNSELFYQNPQFNAQFPHYSIGPTVTGGSFSIVTKIVDNSLYNPNQMYSPAPNEGIDPGPTETQWYSNWSVGLNLMGPGGRGSCSTIIPMVNPPVPINLGGGYSVVRDGANIIGNAYFNGYPILGADENSFSIISATDYLAKDKALVYSYGQVLREQVDSGQAATARGADVNTFASVGGPYYKDANYVWVMPGIGKGNLLGINGADPNTFVYLGGDSAKDANHTYGLDAKGYLVVDGVSQRPTN